ncbi:MAG: DUF2147 domain-containing protein [Caulobacteraceae bacterium]
MLSTLLKAVALAGAVAAVGAAPLPIEGFWQAKSGGGVIELHRCGDALCGRIADSDDLKANPDLRDVNNKHPELRDRRLKGLDIFHGFRGGPDDWSDGRIYNPNDGRTYRGQLHMTAPDRVHVVGCLVFPVCGGQTWTRVK